MKYYNRQMQLGGEQVMTVKGLVRQQKQMKMRITESSDHQFNTPVSMEKH